MPLTLENTTQSEFEHVSIGTTGKMFQEAFASSGGQQGFNNLMSGMQGAGLNDFGDAVTEQIGGFVKNIFGNDSGTSLLDSFSNILKNTQTSFSSGDVAQSAVVRNLDRNNSGIAQYTMKKILNPYMTLMYRGQNFRVFSFDFRYTPKSERESETIHNIIKTFRKAQHPTTEGASFLSYPSSVGITFYNSLTGTNKWLHKFKPCVINSISINSSGAGFYAPMRNGFPAETIMNIQFTENEILNRQDIEDGY
jgi:hypothetical protein